MRLTLIFLIITQFIFAQQKSDTTKQIVDKAFFCNRVINGHSLENTPKGKLELKFYHRMGTINQGLQQFEQAYSFIGLEYGLNNNFMIGLDRSTTQQISHGFLKWKALKQTKGGKSNPIALSLLASVSVNTKKNDETSRPYLFNSRFNYTFQAIVGSKINSNFSVVVLPTMIHKNLVPSKNDHNDIFALGTAARYRLNRKLSLASEYYYVFPHQIVSTINGKNAENPLSLGVEINTGRHVFTILMTNTIGMAEPTFITETNEKWTNTGLRLGFNMTRLFNIGN